MKEMYKVYKAEINKKNKVLLVTLIIFILGLIFGSVYITILGNDEKTLILKKVTGFFSGSNKINFDDRILLFKNSLINNLIFFVTMWLLGLSVIGIPIILIMVFFKSFVTGFSIGSIFACYKSKGIIGILLYIFPNSIITCVFTIFLGTYSLILAIKLLLHAFGKKTLNFKGFMGKYFFILLICILVSILCALFEAFINPSILNLFTNFTK